MAYRTRAIGKNWMPKSIGSEVEKMIKWNTERLPENVKKRYPNGIVPLVNGQALIKAARKQNAMIMACNIRCRLPVEGIVLASMATRAPVMYEIAKSELGYTEFTPADRKSVV